MSGVLEVVSMPAVDERGAFVSVYESAALAEHGAVFEVAQCAISVNRLAGTLRGMHFQRSPHAEAKLIRCLKGAIFDVAVDLRDDSPTRGTWIARELVSTGPTSLFVPAGCAHGFMTLTDDTEVLYLLSRPYVAGSASGLAWDDPALGISWPMAPLVMSARDRALVPYPWRGGSSVQGTTK